MILAPCFSAGFWGGFCFVLFLFDFAWGSGGGSREAYMFFFCSVGPFFFVLLKCSVCTVSVSDEQLSDASTTTLLNAHHDKCSCHLSPYKHTTILWVIVPMLCFYPCD